MRPLALVVFAVVSISSLSCKERAPLVQAEHASASDSSARSTEVDAFLSAWLVAQNEDRYDDYASMYASDFHGVKRTEKGAHEMGRADWLADRKRMFRPGLHVEAGRIASRRDGDHMVVEFEQRFALGSYRDKGPKVLELRSTPSNHLEILSEELRSSMPWPLGEGSSRLPPVTARFQDGVDVYQERGGRSEVVHVDPSGQKITLFSEPGIDPQMGFAVDTQRGRYGFRRRATAPLVVKVAGKETSLASSEKCAPDRFFTNRPWFVGTCRKGDEKFGESANRIVIWDQQTGSILKEMPGHFATAAVADDSIVFLRTAGEDRVDVLRYDPTLAEPTVLDRVELVEEGGPYAVEEVTALDAKTLAYRIYDEHEHRYYTPGGKMFFPGKSYPQDPREQNSLTFSANGRLAAYTERQWNELTYLVVVDLQAKRRTETKFFGSFPKIVGAAIYLVSDPAFVQTKNRRFRQIKNFALYRYDVATGELTQVTTFDIQTQPI